MARLQSANARSFIVERRLLPKKAEPDELELDRVLTLSSVAEKLNVLSSRVRRLTISRRDPEAFHCERSAIAGALQELSKKCLPAVSRR